MRNSDLNVGERNSSRDHLRVGGVCARDPILDAKQDNGVYYYSLHQGNLELSTHPELVWCRVSEELCASVEQLVSRLCVFVSVCVCLYL